MRRTNCRLCGNQNFKNLLSLTPTPPANEFVKDTNDIQESFPLSIFECLNCNHYQLLDIVDPKRLFENYVYVSGTAPSFVRHFRNYACDLISEFDPDPNSLVVDIGSNDGTLLKEFKRNGLKVIGIDPAVNIAKKANEDGILTLNSFFNEKVAQNIINENGKASIITGNNVFAHADDLEEIVLGIKNLLSNNGIFVFEVSYFKDVLQDTLFDTIYHEHVSYHTIKPLVSFFKNYNLELFNVKFINTHGGSIRCYVRHNTNIINNVIINIIENEEKQIKNLSEKFVQNVEKIKNSVVDKLKKIKANGKNIAAYGAPAKATTLCYHFGLDKNIIDFIVDDSPLKQNLFSPGKHIPVLPSTAIYEKKPDYIIILAWNFANIIIKNNQKYLDEGGHFIIPIPELKEI